MTTSNKKKIITLAIAAELVLIACTMIIKISHVSFQYSTPLYFLTLAGAAIITVLLLFRAVSLLYAEKHDVRQQG